MDSEDLKIYMDAMYRRSIEVAIEQALLIRFKDIHSIDVLCEEESCKITIQASTTTQDEVEDFVKELQSQCAKIKLIKTKREFPNP